MNQKSAPFPRHPIKTAAVSVISEATAAANVPADEKINFHIGNPLQDSRLVNLYFELCTGFSTDILKEAEDDTDLTPPDRNKLAFIYEAIDNAVPYTPRVGFSYKKPPAIITHLNSWLLEQEEPLDYSFGKSVAGEVVVSNGGNAEFLRVFFTLIEKFSVYQPAKLITFNYDLPVFFKDFTSIEYTQNFNGTFSEEEFQKSIKTISSEPLLILIGRPLNETERTVLKENTTKLNVLFCELSDLKNHQSLARESGLKENVLRVLSPAIFNEELKSNATRFVLGNADILKLVSALHFELKGTPSATELSCLDYFLQNEVPKSNLQNSEHLHESEYPVDAVKGVFETSGNFVQNLSNKLDTYSAKVEKISSNINSIAHNIFQGMDINRTGTHYYDDLEFKSAFQLFPSILNKPGELSQAFLTQFTKHHSQYNIKNCFVISGSARTAFSLIGKHCNINEVVTFDWSWSYENAFDKVASVPLILNDRLNISGLLEEIESKITEDPNWKQQGAVVVNNPHNASGLILDELSLQKLLIKLLEQDITVIDDLSYQNVAPVRTPIKIKTLKELANEAVRTGSLRSEKINRLITIHSLSKTDCFAGARLSVVEILSKNIHPMFASVSRHIEPNTFAIFLAYLFYRNEPDALARFWRLRNLIFAERADSIKKAVLELPTALNPFGIDILIPQGAMYPQMIINHFPTGISIDNISNRLSQQGIGLVPLTAFSKTADGYDGGRKSFRLTLGGTDSAEILAIKTRRLVIELNRMLLDESREYHLAKLPVREEVKISLYFQQVIEKWNGILKSIEASAGAHFREEAENLQSIDQQDHFINEYLPWRMSVLKNRFTDLIALNSKVITETQKSDPNQIAETLRSELYKETIENRQQKFKNRLFDRTVHPTQMYALKVDVMVEKIFGSLIYGSGKSIDAKPVGLEIVKEFLGTNIHINSEEEAFELIFDLRTMIRNELFTENRSENVLSFWGDWDGSTRPSGQGHRLVAAVLIENVRHMAYFLKTLATTIPNIKIDPGLMDELHNLPERSRTFWNLLNKITSLTNQLEKSYRGLLPALVQPGRSRKLAIKLKLSRDPLQILFSHNNRLEKKMLQLRGQRKNSLIYYFKLNKILRKKLNELIPVIIKNLDDPKIALLAGGYKNLLRRFFLSPRIHQKTITSPDPFTIENTVHNLAEINQIGTRFGNPGIVMALQISMSTNAEALIKLNRMITKKREIINKEFNEHPIEDLWLIPLFEDQQSIDNLNIFLDKLWQFSENSRKVKQAIDERFREITCEIFVAGSDLSQQVGQPKSWELFKETKAKLFEWLAKRGLLDQVRIKLGCGEPIQRQGGYYSDLSARPVLFNQENITNKEIPELSQPAQRSLYYASSPLAGLHLGGDLRTIQSNASEHIFRFINNKERSQFFHHMELLQQGFRNDLQQISEFLQRPEEI